MSPSAHRCRNPAESEGFSGAKLTHAPKEPAECRLHGRKPSATCLKYVGCRDRPIPNRPQVANLPHNTSVGIHPHLVGRRAHEDR